MTDTARTRREVVDSARFWTYFIENKYVKRRSIEMVEHVADITSLGYLRFRLPVHRSVLRPIADLMDGAGEEERG